MTHRTLLYARFSSDRQNEASIEDQLRICRVRAEREGWLIAGEYTDAAISGATLARPGYQALLADLRAGRADIVLTESLDRLSRDQEHLAGFYKTCLFKGVRIVSLSEGEADAMHVGLRGMMGALYLKDLADKTRRGEEGRVLKGRSMGTASYGYRVVRQFDAAGEPDRGLREIDLAEAAVIRRIFADYVAGRSPLAIARTLNAEGVPGPTGGLWHPASIRGRPTRGDGVLRNPIYVGRLLWNRHRSFKDPVTETTVRRANPIAAVVEVDVPHLRIIDDALWQAAQSVIARETLPSERFDSAEQPGFWDRRRPKFLVTGKVFCGSCGSAFASVGRNYLACPAGRYGTCANKASLQRSKLEAAALRALTHEIMRVADLEGFVAAFTAEWNHRAKATLAAHDGLKRELAGVERKLENVIDALTNGFRGASLQGQLDKLEAQAETLRARLTSRPASRPALHPDMALAYKQRLGQLATSLEQCRSPDVLEAARAFIEKIIITPSDDPDDAPKIELIAAFNALLTAGGADIPTQETNTHEDASSALFYSSAKAALGPLDPATSRGIGFMGEGPLVLFGQHVWPLSHEPDHLK